MDAGLPLGYLLNELAQEFRVRTSAALVPFELSTRELGLMICLGQNGTVTQSHLGRLHRIDRTSMVGHIDHLEARGYVERRSDAGDRRVHLICLTDLGRSVMEDARKFTDEVERDVTGAMTDRQREIVRDLLTRTVDDITGHDR